jgi:2-polyprenyl-3-methyl-5-hydroxy-6-metoxy-1,4-benzoquinol methylase
MSMTAELTEAARERLERRLRYLPPARRLRFGLALASLERFADGMPIRVLDAGAGEALLSLAIARRHPEWTVVAADLRGEALQRGRDEADRAEVANLRFEQRDLTQPLGGPVYDAVLALECLEEIPDDEAAVASLASALHPGGLLLVHVPEREWTPVLRGSERTWKDQVRHGYSRTDLIALLERHGLEVRRVTPTTRGTVRLAQEVRDRIKTARLAVRALAYPALTVALWLERVGFTWGPARALYAEARKP